MCDAPIAGALPRKVLRISISPPSGPPDLRTQPADVRIESIPPLPVSMLIRNMILGGFVVAVAVASTPHRASAQSAAPADSARPAEMAPPPPPERPRPRRDFITQEQARASTARNAYELIEHLHPNWLRKHGGDVGNGMHSTGVAVFLQGHEMEGVQNLRDIGIDQVVSIQYLGSVEASAAYGPGHEQGAILVSSL